MNAAPNIPKFGFLSTGEFAALMNMDEETPRRWVRANDYPPGMPIRPIKVGSRLKWPASAVYRFVQGSAGADVPSNQAVPVAALDSIALACADECLVAKINALSRRRVRLAERLADSWLPITLLALAAERDGLTLDEALQQEQARIEEDEAVQAHEIAKWTEARLVDRAARRRLDTAARARQAKAEAELKCLARAREVADQARAGRMRLLQEAGVTMADAERLIGPAADDAQREEEWLYEAEELFDYLGDPLRRTDRLPATLLEALERAAKSGDCGHLAKDAPYPLTSEETERARDAAAY